MLRDERHLIPNPFAGESVSELVVTRADEALVDFAAIGAASGTAWGGLWVRSSACSFSLYPSRGERHAIQVVQPV